MRFIKTPTVSTVYLPTPHMPRVTAKWKARFVYRGHKIVDYQERWIKNFLYRAGGAMRAWITQPKKAAKPRPSKRLGIRIVPLPLPERLLPPSERKHSPVGTPPFSHKPIQDFVKRTVQFAVNLRARYVLVGTVYSIGGRWGWKHEHGGKYGRKRPHQFPKRPFIKPGAERWVKYGLPTLLARSKEFTYGLPKGSYEAKVIEK